MSEKSLMFLLAIGGILCLGVLPEAGMMLLIFLIVWIGLIKIFSPREDD